MIIAEDLYEKIDRLPSTEKWRLVRHVLETLEREQPVPVADNDYQKFLTETYGSLRDTPIERGEQGEYEEREPLE